MTDELNEPWLNIIGIGEGGTDDVSDLGWSLIAQSKTIIGGQRHLAMIADDLTPDAERIVWPSPFSKIYAELEKIRGQQVVILASGDPMCFGIGGTLTRHFDRSEMRVLPAPSSFSLAASRLGWPLNKTSQLTIHGRNPASLLPHYTPGARLFILSKDSTSPSLVAKQLCNQGIENASITVLEHLGGDKEKIIESDARTIKNGGETLRFADLNVLAVALPDQLPHWLPTIAGLPDDAFEHDGKMTKRDIRASALAKLAPHPNALLWDVGTGCGSIAIEWMRSHASCRAVGIEPQEKRRVFAEHNAQQLGTPGLRLLASQAPDGLRGEEAPDAIFIGGGLSVDVVNFCLRALKPRGRLVAHAVTLGSERLLLEMFERHGGDLTRLSIAKASPVGPHFGWKTSMPVTQWAFVKDA
ncbi:precorrin-6y C5,15-methyltransferase (decarboxylating) subunit CbiE [Cohaesibacter celericrescens]|uniref:Cobalamin biosynthesis bifunctional protein CbiET n=1 Tax=Cohaesibacter celericrescens TaxID=2067669 RepID=A0A2N5XVW8_9HYPH|nr:precorrin-6y C5,15-methyltransferase (decarboxylating) subunit CbiE [Cohaesibacter celericrescens]PLW78630.1 cobalamin biosynthesis bifunctional protein CbiET [Cohaesibacter celericrescens]